MIGLTEKQNKVLNFIRFYIEEQGFPPSRRDIADSFGMTAGGAQDHLQAIRRKGYISIAKNISRGIVVLK